MSRFSPRNLSIVCVALFVICIPVPSIVQAATLTFDLSVDGSNGALGGSGSYGHITADDSGGSLRIDAELPLVPPFVINKDDVTATFRSATLFDMGTAPLVEIDVFPPNYAPIPGSQFDDPAFHEDKKPPTYWDFAIACLTDPCGRKLQFTVTHVDASNNPIYDLTVASLNPLSYANNNGVPIYFVISLVNTSTGAVGSVGATLIPEVPLPGAAWLLGSVLLGGYSIQRWRRLQRTKAASTFGPQARN